MRLLLVIISYFGGIVQYYYEEIFATMMWVIFMTNYILVLIATVLLAFEFAFSRKYQTMEGTAMAAGLRFNMLTGLFTTVAFFCLNGFRLEFSWFSILMVALAALCGTAYNVISFRILKTGGMALYSLFLMLGGMLLPYVYGVCYLDEILTVWRILGVLVIGAAVVLSCKAKYRFSGWVYLWCVIVFLLNGCVSIFSKVHQVDATHSTISTTAFVMYGGLGRFLFSSVALLVMGKKGGKPKSHPMGILGVAAAAATISGVSYLLQLTGAEKLPATVLYPMVTGGSIVFSALSGKVFFKEKLSWYQIVSICLCFLGTLLFL